MTAAIVTEQLSKYYGKTPGILDLDLEVSTGEVFGFLGPNGAGKTTTIRTLLDLLHPTSGRATILGLDSQTDSVEVRKRCGFLPAELELYDEMTGRELAFYFGSLRGFDAWDRVDTLAERLNFDLDQKIASYSSGTRQKIGILQAVMHEPELLILDEPTVALDPLMQQEFYQLIDEIRADGRTVFLSSHVLPVVERLADRVGIVRQSRLIVVEETETLKAKARRRLLLTFSGPVTPRTFETLPGVHEVRINENGHFLEVVVEGSVDAVLKEASKNEVENVVTHDGDLEDAFLAYYRTEG
ncbi:MAG: ABC transporter ATP-binding protein [Acidimicrobiia bacterium]